MPHEHSVLVVEDDGPTRSATAELLSAAGFRSWTARDGREALKRLRRQPKPCLILLDMMMPGMTGWEFLEHHRESADLKSVPLVLLTGWLGTTKAQAKAIVPKPVDPSRLLRVLRRVLPDGTCTATKRATRPARRVVVAARTAKRSRRRSA